jgi:HPt (histidine-containing phosphotransfer) domain-containing protein
MDIKVAAENIGLDEASYRDLLNIFVQSSREDLERLRAALAESDSAGVADAAHSLRGAAGNLDLREISHLAGELESRARGGSLEDASQSLEALKAHLETVAGAVEN